MRIVIFGYGEPLYWIIDILHTSKDIELVGIAQDYVRDGKEQEKFVNVLKSKNTKLLAKDWIKKVKIDLILVINFNRIIDTKIYQNTKIVNIHMGLLPKYRGNNANAWAVINGEKRIGYTLHAIDEELDTGDIYHRFFHNIKKDGSYHDAKIAIRHDIETNLIAKLFEIASKKIKIKSQKGSQFVYCTKLRSEDGIISNWNLTSDSIMRMNYVFAKPLGTGLKFIYKNKIFCINRLSKIPNFAKSVGVPGSIVNKVGNSLWIKVSDTAVSLDEIVLDEKSVDVRTYFKIGQRLTSK